MYFTSEFSEDILVKIRVNKSTSTLNNNWDFNNKIKFIETLINYTPYNLKNRIRSNILQASN